MKEYKVMASNMFATYKAGRYTADSAEDACTMAFLAYAVSVLGRELEDADAFRFYTVDKWPDEEEDEE